MSVSSLRVSIPTVKAEMPAENPETGFSTTRFLQAAILTAAAAGAFFAMQFPLMAVSASFLSLWLFATSIIGVLYHYAAESIFDDAICYLHSRIMELNAFVISTFFFPLSCFEKYHEARGPENGNPILLLHGHMSFAAVWEPMRRRLIEEKLGPVYTMNMGNGVSMETYEKEIEKKVGVIEAKFREKNSNAPFQMTLVGHSRGGLAAAGYAAKNLDKVLQVITIGTPFEGSKSAYLCPGDDARQMESHSQYLKNLKTQFKQKRIANRLFCIASSADTVVSEKSALPEFVLQDHQYLVNHVGHSSILWSSKVADRVIQAIRKEERSPSGSQPTPSPMHSRRSATAHLRRNSSQRNFLSLSRSFTSPRSGALSSLERNSKKFSSPEELTRSSQTNQFQNAKSEVHRSDSPYPHSRHYLVLNYLNYEKVNEEPSNSSQSSNSTEYHTGESPCFSESEQR